MGKGYMYESMFKLNIINKNKNTISAYMVESFCLWHYKLGYLNYRKLNDMYKLDLIPVFNNNIEKCNTCMLTKITRNPFPKVKRKTKLLDKFKVYKSDVDLQCESFIKCLRSDRGGEYYNPSYFELTGIVHQVSAPYTPQQNGVAERKNRVLTEMVNSMLSYSSLGQDFWGEVVLIACHILNRVPNKETKITP